MRPAVLALAILIAVAAPTDVMPLRARATLASPEHTLYLPSVSRRAVPSIAVRDQLGGRTSAVAPIGESHVLAAIGSRLAPFEVRPDGSLQPAGPPLKLRGLVHSIAVDGDLALVVTRYPAALLIVDVVQPARPKILGQATTPGTPVDMAVANGRIVLCEERHVRTIELGRATQLLEIGALDLGRARAERCALTAGGGLIVSATERTSPYSWDRFLLVIDVSIPTSPSLADRIDSGLDQVLEVAADGDEAYALLAATIPLSPPMDRTIGQSLLHLDLSTPDSPAVVGDERSYVWGGWSGALAMRDGLVYVATPAGFAVHDAGSGARIGATPLSHPAFSVAVVGDRAVVAGHGLASVDISDPATPRETVRREIPAEFVAITHRAQTVYAVEVEGSSRQMRLAEIDASDPWLTVRRWWPVAGGRAIDAIDVAVTDSAAVVLVADEARVYDMRDEGAQVPVASVVPSQWEMEYLSIEATADGRHIVALSHGDYYPTVDCYREMLVGLDVINLDRPDEPRVVSEARLCFDESTPYFVPTDLRVTGNHAFLTVCKRFNRNPRTYSSGGTVVAVDMSDTREPREVARYRYEGWPGRHLAEFPGVFGVAADASHVYLGGTASGFAVLEIDGEGGFREVGDGAVSGRADRIVVDRGIAFVADNGGFREYTQPVRAQGKLTALDVSRPSDPRLLSVLEPIQALDMTVVDGELWIAAGIDGLAVYSALP